MMCVTLNWHHQARGIQFKASDWSWLICNLNFDIFISLISINTFFMSQIWYSSTIINELLKSTGKYLTKEGNKCNFLYSDRNIKERLGKYFRQRHSCSFYSSLHFLFTSFRNWVGNDCLELYFPFSAFSLMARWRYEGIVDCHLYVDDQEPFSSSPALSTMEFSRWKDMRSSQHMHNWAALCKSLF